MQETTARNFRILAFTQAIAGGVIAVVFFGLHSIGPSWLPEGSPTLLTAVLGAVALVFYLTIYQLTADKHLALSTLVLTIISSTGILLMVIGTGGLDSPFYALWLLVIVAVGTFGRAQIAGVLGITIMYYLITVVQEGYPNAELTDRVVQLAITLVAGGLSVWINNHARQTTSTTKAQLQHVSSQLSTEQIKADTIISSISENLMTINATGRIQLFNAAAEQITGWDQTSTLGLDYSTVFKLTNSDGTALNPENDPIHESWTKHQSVVRRDLAATSRSGRRLQINLSVSPLFTSGGQPQGAIALFRDISKEKEVERQKDEFVSTASHEMRTPVAAIEGYIALAMNPNVATIDDRAKSYLDKAHQTIAHLGELFRDLLSVTKAEEGQLTAKIEPVNIDKLLTDVNNDMQFAAQKKHLTLIYQNSSAAGKAIAPLYYVAVNSERLREVVMNLIENAFKFTSEGGVKITLEGNDAEVTVAVADTGLGIAAEDIPHLFQKFYRVDSSATRTIGGTGLGLYLCRRVVEAFNGRIWIESKLGEGSTFKFTLPRLSQAELEQMQAALATNAPTAQNPPVAQTAPALAAPPSQPSSGPATITPIAMPIPEETNHSESASRHVQ
jgi:PAS domain S-box-containing protein